MGESHLAKIVVQFLSVRTGDGECHILKDKSLKLLGYGLLTREGDQRWHLGNDRMASLLGKTVADARGAGGGVGEASGSYDEGVTANGGAILKANAVPIFGKTLNGTVLSYFHVRAFLKVVDKGKEDVEGLATLGVNAATALLNQGDVALLEEVH